MQTIFVIIEQHVIVTVVKGIFLVDVDEILRKDSGKMDPYAQILFQDQKFQTKVATNQGKAPLWKETFSFNYSPNSTSLLKIEVFDKDIGVIVPEVLGVGKFDISQLLKEQKSEYTMVIEKDGKKQGDVYLQLDFKGLSPVKHQHDNKESKQLKEDKTKNSHQEHENTLNESIIEYIKEPAQADNYQSSNPTKVRGSQFFLTDRQITNEQQMQNIKSLNKMDTKTNATHSKVIYTNTLLHKLNAQLTPDKSVTSLFMNSQKMYDPKKIQIQGTNDSILSQQQFKDVNEYFDHIFVSQDLGLQAKHEADQVMKDCQLNQIQKIFKGDTKISSIAEEIEEPLQIQENEYEQIQALQDRIIRKDIMEYEKTRKQIALQLVDLEPDYFGLRVDEFVERQRIESLRKQLTQKLLYIEDRIQAMKLSQTIDSKNHHFSSNSNLHNSQLELSIISVQKDYVNQWEHDPEKEKIRKDFIERVMKEWQEIQDKRVIKLIDMENEIKKQDQIIKQIEDEKIIEQSLAKRKEIMDNLEQLKINQIERKKLWQDSQINLEKIKKQQTLANKYAAQDAKFFVSELEKRKNRLQQIKEEYQPQNFNLNQVNDHDKKFLQIQIDEAAKRGIKKDHRAAEWTKFEKLYFSENYRKAQDDVKIIRNPQEEQLKKAQLKVEKQKSINKIVKEKFLPKIDQKKQEEMVSVIEGLQHHSDFKYYQDVSQKLKGKRRYEGININKYKSTDSQSKRSIINPIQTDNLNSVGSPKGQGQVSKKFANNSNQSPYRSQEGKLPQIMKTSSAQYLLQKIDYLKERRENKIFQKRDIMHDWERLAQNQKGSIKDFVDNPLLIESKKIEKAARKYEQLLRARNLSDNKLVEDEQEVNTMLVNSIKAKLFVLDQDAGFKINNSKPLKVAMKVQTENPKSKADQHSPKKSVAEIQSPLKPVNAKDEESYDELYDQEEEYEEEELPESKQQNISPA